MINTRAIRNLYVVIISTVISYSCSYEQDKYRNNSEYQFDELKLVRNSSNGEIAWKLSSPEARFDPDNSLIRAKSTEIKLYSNNSAKYLINSNSLTSINDVGYVLLEGDVKLESLIDSDLLLTGDRLKWDVQSNTLHVDQNPLVYYGDTKITSSKIYFNIDDSDLMFVGNTTFTVEPKNNLSTSPEKLIINSNDANWNVDSGKIYSPKKVYGSRIGLNESNNFSFIAQSLTGNLNSNRLQLLNCYLERNKFVTTNADKCIFNLTLNSSSASSIRSEDQNANSPVTFPTSKEKVFFRSLQNSVRTILKLTKPE